ncbi:MAG: trypsin-like peptidase domain-containing protein [Blastocatellia bacterium]|nr:trypsin-like peptidase domain-containing protein [Blastocatellia bacterium]
MKRGILFSFLCAMAVGTAAVALVVVSFIKPQSFRPWLLGQKKSLLTRAGGAAAIVETANSGVVTVIAMRALREEERTAGMSSDRNVQRGTGTGFIIDAEGFIVTNEHVIRDATLIRVKLADGRERRAEMRGADAATDLALLKIDAERLTPLDLGDSDAVRVGDSVIAIGNPVEYERTVTAGIVSAKGRKVYGKEPFEDFIQTDAAINRGNSGGPLLSASGEVIGVNTVIRVDASGISFAVPSNVVKRVVGQLRASGQVARGYLGLTPVNLTPEYREALQLGETRGVLVADVTESLPAARAGIEPYDIVTHFDGRAIRHTDDFFAFVANTPPQQRVEVTVLRGGQPLTLQATLDQRPLREEARAAETRPAAEKSQQNAAPSLGFSVRENTPAVWRELRLDRLPGRVEDRVTEGVIISDLDPLGPAGDSRLSVGYVIFEANRQPIRTLDDFARATSALAPGSVLVVRYTPLSQRSVNMTAIRVGEK